MDDIVFGSDFETVYYLNNFADVVGSDGTYSPSICGKRSIELYSSTFSAYKVSPGPNPALDPFKINLTETLSMDSIGTHRFLLEVRLVDYPTVAPLTLDFNVTIRCPLQPFDFYVNQTQVQDIVYSTSEGKLVTLPLPKIDYRPYGCFTPKWTLYDMQQNTVPASSSVFQFNTTHATI